MSESGVIPRPEDRGSYREIGCVADSIDGVELEIGVEDGMVAFGLGLTRWRFSATQAEEFARLFVAACWQATMPP